MKEASYLILSTFLLIGALFTGLSAALALSNLLSLGSGLTLLITVLLSFTAFLGAGFLLGGSHE